MQDKSIRVFLEALRADAGVTIAAGAALQEIDGEWIGCESGCTCEPCSEFDRLAV